MKKIFKKLTAFILVAIMSFATVSIALADAIDTDNGSQEQAIEFMPLATNAGAPRHELEAMIRSMVEAQWDAHTGGMIGTVEDWLTDTVTDFIMGMLEQPAFILDLLAGAIGGPIDTIVTELVGGLVNSILNQVGINIDIPEIQIVGIVTDVITAVLDFVLDIEIVNEIVERAIEYTVSDLLEMVIEGSSPGGMEAAIQRYTDEIFNFAPSLPIVGNPLILSLTSEYHRAWDAGGSNVIQTTARHGALLLRALDNINPFWNISIGWSGLAGTTFNMNVNGWQNETNIPVGTIPFVGGFLDEFTTIDTYITARIIIDAALDTWDAVSNPEVILAALPGILMTNLQQAAIDVITERIEQLIADITLMVMTEIVNFLNPHLYTIFGVANFLDPTMSFSQIAAAIEGAAFNWLNAQLQSLGLNVTLVPGMSFQQMGQAILDAAIELGIEFALGVLEQLSTWAHAQLNIIGNAVAEFIDSIISVITGVQQDLVNAINDLFGGRPIVNTNMTLQQMIDAIIAELERMTDEAIVAIEARIDAFVAYLEDLKVNTHTAFHAMIAAVIQCLRDWISDWKGKGPTEPADDSITVTFTGVYGVTVRYHSNTPGHAGWRTIVADVDNEYIFTFDPDSERVPSHVQVERNGMTYTFDLAQVVMTPGQPTLLEVPLRTIAVSGINAPGFAPAAVSIVQGGWVYQNIPVQGNNVANPFIVFDNGRVYEVRISVAGYHNLAGRFTATTGNQNIWFGQLFSQHLVPEGVTNIRISNANWVDTTIVHSSGMGGEVITLFNNQTQAWLTFDFGGRTYTCVPFMLDATNPWGNMTIINFEGMTNVRLRGITSWDDVTTETFDHYAIFMNLTPGSNVRGYATTQGGIRSIDMPVGAGFNVVNLPIAYVEISGIEIPGLMVSVHRANAAGGPVQLVQQVPELQGGEFSFHTFRTDMVDNQYFVIRLGGVNWTQDFNLGRPEFLRQGYQIDLSDLFYTLTVPTGVTGVYLRNAAGAIINNVSNLQAGDTFTLINSGFEAFLTFTYNGAEYNIDIYMDGNCPWDDITIVRFDGMENVMIQTNIGIWNAWVNAEGIHDDFIVLFGLQDDTRIRGIGTNATSVAPNLNYFSLEVVGGGGFSVLEIPVSEVIVTGIPAGFSIDVRRSNDAYLESGLLVARHQPHAGGELRFNTFTTAHGEDQIFMARVSGQNFGNIDRFFVEYFTDISDLQYEVAIPAGVTGVTVRTAFDPNGPVLGGVLNQNDGSFYLMRTDRDAYIRFTYNNRVHTMPFVLNGSNPFDNITIVEFGGMENVTIQTNFGPHNAWNTLGTYDDYAILFDLPSGTRIRGFVGTTNYTSLEYVGGGIGFDAGYLPVSQVTVMGFPQGFNIDVRRSNDDYLTTGHLIARHQSHAGGTLQFPTFTTPAGDDQIFLVSVSGLQFAALVRFFDDYAIDLSDYFYTITIPADITGVTIRTSFDPNGPVVGGVNNQSDGTFLLMETMQWAQIRFTHGGVQRTLDFQLDGTCPFEYFFQLADYTDLDAAIKAAEARTEANYTTSSWSAFQDALNAAKDVDRYLLAHQQDIIDNATAALEIAYENLEARADFANLEDAIDAAIARIKGDGEYVPVLVKALEAAVEYAKDLLDYLAPHDNVGISQQQIIDDAEQAIRDAIDALVERWVTYRFSDTIITLPNPGHFKYEDYDRITIDDITIEWRGDLGGLIMITREDVPGAFWVYDGSNIYVCEDLIITIDWSFIWGDVNGDGAVNQEDVDILELALAMNNFEGFDLRAANVARLHDMPLEIMIAASKIMIQNFLDGVINTLTPVPPTPAQ